MNKKQKICIIVGILLLTPIFLFPPWYYEEDVEGVEQLMFYPDNSFILNPPPPPINDIVGFIYETRYNKEVNIETLDDLKQMNQLHQELRKEGFWDQHFIDEPHISISQLITRVAIIYMLIAGGISTFSDKHIIGHP